MMTAMLYRMEPVWACTRLNFAINSIWYGGGHPVNTSPSVVASVRISVYIIQSIRQKYFLGQLTYASLYLAFWCFSVMYLSFWPSANSFMAYVWDDSCMCLHPRRHWTQLRCTIMYTQYRHCAANFASLKLIYQWWEPVNKWCLSVWCLY